MTTYLNAEPWRSYARIADHTKIHLVADEDVVYREGAAFPEMRPACRNADMAVGDLIPMWALSGERLAGPALNMPLCQDCVAKIGIVS